MQSNYQVILIYRILYVDDEPSLLEVGKLFLERREPFVVDTLTSATEALNRLKTELYDVIISDYQMPDMDGIAFLKQLKSSGNLTPFILFTGRGREEVVIEALNEGADFYLQKGGDLKSQFVELAYKIRQAVARRRAEDSLKESEKRLSDIIEFLPNATFAIDREGVIIAWNRAIEEMTGFSAEMMLGKGDYEYALPFYGKRRPILIDLIFEPVEIIEHRYSHITREKDVLIADVSLPSLQDRDVMLLCKASLLYNSQGEVVGAIESIRDITEQRRAEEELMAAYEQIAATEEELRIQYDELKLNQKIIEESEEKYRTLVDHTMDGVFIAQDGRYAAVNKALLSMTGFDEQDLLGKPLSILIAPEDQEMVMARHKSRLSGNQEPEIYEISLIHKDRQTRILIKMSVGMGTYQGRPATIGTAHNITEERKREKLLMESEERYRSVVNDQVDLIARFTPGGVITFVNEAFRLFFFPSMEREDILRRNFREILQVQDFPDEERYIQSLTREHPVCELERLCTGWEGNKYWIIWSIRAIFGMEETITEYQVVGRDVTLQKQAEQSLRESEKKFRELVTMGPFMVTVMDLDGRYLFINKAFEETSGYLLSEVIGKTSCDLGFLSRNEFMTMADHFRKGGQIDGYESVTKIRDGSERNVLTSGRYITIDGKPQVICVVLDITERKRAEDELQAAYEELAAAEEELRTQYNSLAQSQAEWESTFNTISDWIAIISPDGTILRTNKAVESLLGIASDTVTGMNCFELIHGTDCQIEGCPRKRMLKSKKREMADIQRRDGNGWLQVTVDPVLSSTGEVERIIHLVRDVTEYTRSQKALEQAKKKLSILNQVTFNDIQNFIFILSGYQHLTKEAIQDESVIANIEVEDEILQKIAQSLKFAQSYQDLGIPSPRWQDVNHVFLLAISHLDFLRINHTEFLEGLEIFADPLLEQVLQILADDTLVHGKTATKVRLWYKKEGESVILIYEDDGVGIPEDTKNLIFSSDFQKKRGVGLFLAREILEITGISIRETGEPGQGARFEMMVPKGMFRFADT